MAQGIDRDRLGANTSDGTRSPNARPARRRAPHSACTDRPRLDFQDHLADLEAKGLLVRIDRADQQGHRAASAGALAVHRRHAGGRAARLPVHQRDRLQGPPLRHAGGGRRARGLARDLCDRHGPAGRRDRRSLDAAPSPIRSRRSRSTRRRCQEVVITGDELQGAGRPGAPAGAGLDAGLRLRALSHRDALRHPRSR